MSKAKFVFLSPQVALSVLSVELGMTEIYKAGGTKPRLVVSEDNLELADKLMNTPFGEGGLEDWDKAEIEVIPPNLSWIKDFWALVGGDCVVIGMWNS